MSPTPQKKEHPPTLQVIQTFLMSVCTALVIGCFGFLWNINAVVSAQAVKIENNKDNIAELKNRVDGLTITAADHAYRLTKLELKK